MSTESTRVIDIPIQQLWTRFDQNSDGKLTRNQLSIFLNDVFKRMHANKTVSEDDVNNFLLDYSINHPGELTKKDFQGITKLRFYLNTKLVDSMSIHHNSILQRSVHITPQPAIQPHFMKSIKQVQSMNTIQLNRTIHTPKKTVIKQVLQTGKIQRKIPNPAIHENQTQKVIIPVPMIFDVFNRSRNGKLTLKQMREVLILIFRDFGIGYNPTEIDVINFLKDFDINSDREITQTDFRGSNILVFRFQQRKIIN